MTAIFLRHALRRRGFYRTFATTEATMLEFFKEGGWSMFPVITVGFILVWGALRYAIDREPARRPFLTVLSLALLAFTLQGVLSDVATVFWAISSGKFASENQTMVMFEGLKESSRPALLGLGLLGIALVFVSIGAYRTGLRELRAARG